MPPNIVSEPFPEVRIDKMNLRFKLCRLQGAEDSFLKISTAVL